MGTRPATKTKAPISLAGLAPVARAACRRRKAPASSRWLKEGRCWGVACQLYSLCSPRNAGIGDFEDLARFAEITAEAGADFVGVNPLHALFLAAPSAAAPSRPPPAGSSTRSTSPSTRRRPARRRSARPPASCALPAGRLSRCRRVQDEGARRALPHLRARHGGRRRRGLRKLRAAGGEALYLQPSSRRFRSRWRERAMPAGKLARGISATPHRSVAPSPRSRPSWSRFIRGCSGSPTGSSARRRRGRAPPACASGSISTSPSASRPTAPRPGRTGR